MHRTLISQILAENDYVQKLHIAHGISPIMAAHRRMHRLAKELKRLAPRNEKYCVVCTILSICAETEVDQLRHYEEKSSRDECSTAERVLTFERLQYQMNQAALLLA